MSLSLVDHFHVFQLIQEAQRVQLSILTGGRQQGSSHSSSSGSQVHGNAVVGVEARAVLLPQQDLCPS